MPSRPRHRAAASAAPFPVPARGIASPRGFARSLTRALALPLALAVPLSLAGCHRTSPRPLLLVSTTTTQDSGVLDRLVPAAEKDLGFPIRVIALGSGEALAHAERGDADVLITHSPVAEEKVVKEGHLVDRAPLMWNRFFVVGPPEDPAKVAETHGDTIEAFKRIRASGSLFVSRGDESGTHVKERALWKAAGLPAADPHVLSTGQGQAETVLVAAQKKAYALVDSSTWRTLHATGLVVLLDPAKDPPPHGAAVTLVNPYHVMRENPAAHPETLSAQSKAFYDWVTGPKAAAILSSGGLFLLGSPPS